MFCWILPYITMNSHRYAYILCIPALLNLLPTSLGCHRILSWAPWKWKWKSVSCVWLCDPMDCTVHEIFQARILEWVTSITQQISTNCFTYGNVYVSVLLSQFAPLSPSPCCVHKSVFYVSISTAALQIDPSVPFF